MTTIKFTTELRIEANKGQVVVIDDEMAHRLCQLGVAEIVPRTDYLTQPPERKQFVKADYAMLM